MDTLIHIINVGAWLNFCAAQLSTTTSSMGLNQAAWIAILISTLSVSWFVFNL